MTTKKKMRRREKQKLRRECFSLDYYLMSNLSKHLKQFYHDLKHSSCKGYPAFLEKHPNGFEEWLSIVSDIVYFAESYDVFISGKPKDQNEFDEYWKERKILRHEKTENGLFKVSIPENMPEMLYGLDAVDRIRYLRGKKYLIKYFSSLWW